MLALPDALVEHLGKVRASYLAFFQHAIDAAIANHAGQILIEAEVAPEGKTPELRIDLVEMTDDGARQQFITTRSTCPYSKQSFPIDDVELVVDELVWNAVTLIGHPTPSSTAFVGEWYRTWFEHGAAVEKPFGGYPHFMADIEFGDDLFRLDFDLGSAPVEALRDLLDRCVERGVRTLWLQSGADALAGTIPDAEPNDDDMIELPDDVLDYLAGVRAEYLHLFRTKLDQLLDGYDGRLGIEAAAGPTDGEPAIRLDIVLERDGKFEPHHIVTAPQPRETTEHTLAGGAQLGLGAVLWQSALVTGFPSPSNPDFLAAWYRRWFFDGFDVGEPFRGFIHYMKMLRMNETGFVVHLDLGSAPVEAVRDLFEHCVQHGVQTLFMSSVES